ncbi:MAG: tryptophan-rich sensory protein [Anaerolineales bacterium]|nr:tryptophan-rich sensory protein [Anaerolineales bacterium]
MPTSTPTRPFDQTMLRQIINVFAVIATITVNALANIIPFNGQLTGEISDRFVVYFVPAGYVFSIWGLIYLALGAFAVFQALPSQRDNPLFQKIGYWFALSCAANAIWIFFWHYNLFVLSLLAMLVLLGSLLVIYLRVNIGKGHGTPTQAEKWFIHIPFSIYLGWITVATIANLTDVLEYVEWNRWGLADEVWYLIILGAALLITSGVSLLRRDLAYMLVIVWAFVGISVKHAATPIVANPTWGAVGLVVLVYIIGWANRQNPPNLKNSAAPR